MADYSFGSIRYLKSRLYQGNDIGFNHVGYTGAGQCSYEQYHQLILNAKCKIGNIKYTARGVNVAQVTYKCRINKSSTDPTATSGGYIDGTVSFSGSGNSTVATLSFNNAVLDAGTWYVWFYFEKSGVGYFGAIYSGTVYPPVFASADITKSSISIYMKISSTQAKATDELYMKTGASASKKATNFYIKTGSSSYKEIK